MTLQRINSIRQVGLLFALVLASSQHLSAQSADSSQQSGFPALQFQLFGGFGVNFLGQCGSSSFFRIGADVSLNLSNSSGTSGESYTSYSTSGTSSTSQSPTTSGNPEYHSTSYQITLTALYVRSIVSYAHTSLYVGGGLAIQHSKSWFSSSSSYATVDTTTLTTGSSENTDNSKSIGVGPVALCGVKTHLLTHLMVSAEVSLTAMHQWSWSTSSFSYSSSAGGSSPSSSGYRSTSNSNDKAWTLSLSNIRIGVILEL